MPIKKNHSILYDEKNRRLIINELFIVVAFRTNSLNHLLFDYLNKHQGRAISYQELDEHVFKGRYVDLTKVVDAMGFRGDLKKILFHVNAKEITYKPADFCHFSELIKVF